MREHGNMQSFMIHAAVIMTFRFVTSNFSNKFSSHCCKKHSIMPSFLTDIRTFPPHPFADTSCLSHEKAANNAAQEGNASKNLAQSLCSGRTQLFCQDRYD